MELRFVRGIMQLQSGNRRSQNGETRPDPTRPDME